MSPLLRRITGLVMTCLVLSACACGQIDRSDGFGPKNPQGLVVVGLPPEVARDCSTLWLIFSRVDRDESTLPEPCEEVRKRSDEAVVNDLNTMNSESVTAHCAPT
ncbi:MAG: hypothetical protein GDA49_12670 [Rhodospirillales bacterium]|nr:hypothetical protein [Rhodospirillales bacterium]